MGYRRITNQRKIKNNEYEELKKYFCDENGSISSGNAHHLSMNKNQIVDTEFILNINKTQLLNQFIVKHRVSDSLIKIELEHKIPFRIEINSHKNEDIYYGSYNKEILGVLCPFDTFVLVCDEKFINSLEDNFCTIIHITTRHYPYKWDFTKTVIYGDFYYEGGCAFEWDCYVSNTGRILQKNEILDSNWITTGLFKKGYGSFGNTNTKPNFIENDNNNGGIDLKKDQEFTNLFKLDILKFKSSDQYIF